MKMMLRLLFVIIVLGNSVAAQSIIIDTKDVTVWARDQVIEGRVSAFYNTNALLFHNGDSVSFSINADSSFTVSVRLSEGVNTFRVKCDTGSGVLVSDTVRLTLGYDIEPEIYGYAEVTGFDVTLRAAVIENPDSLPLSFTWSEDIDNPVTGVLASVSDSTASFTLTGSEPDGEYYFDLICYSDYDTVKARTYITKKGTSIIPFSIKHDYAGWIDSAVIYEITPYIFVNFADWTDITRKLTDFKDLGVNTLWLQPVYLTHFGGQGYDVTDYYNVRTDLGPEEDFRELVDSAKSMGFKVILDFVPSHSSSMHPYARHSVKYGDSSHYYHYYVRSFIDAPYSQFYNVDANDFYYYFWPDLPMLNYGNPEVEKWITEAMIYWIEEYDIDGYRFDAVWGTSAKFPEYTKKLRLALKRIKPEVLLLAEDKATWPETFDERFDLAFDWFPEESWVSHWVFATMYSETGNPTVFNYPNESMRSSLLRDALTNNGNGYAPDAKILRFLENNDMYHFITHHGVNRTKMAAALEFTLHGVPLIYNGQEIGAEGHPYETEFLFLPGFSIKSSSRDGLYEYYQRLVDIRLSSPALYSDNYHEIPVSPSGSCFGFRRWKDNENVFTILNMYTADKQVSATLPVDSLGIDTSRTYYLTELISGEVIEYDPSTGHTVSFDMDMHSAKVFAFADSIVPVTPLVSVNNDKDIPEKFSLSQNYPNPFNPETKISFTLPETGEVTLIVYDLLGREVDVLVKGIKEAGAHTEVFNGSKLASGVYLYRIQYSGKVFTKKMLLIK